MRITLDSTVLDKLLSRAAPAARLVGCIDDGLTALAPSTQLPTRSMRSVPEISELLGEHHLAAEPVPADTATTHPPAVLSMTGDVP